MRHTVEGILSEARNRGEIRPDVDLEAATRVINALLITTGDTELFPYLNNYTQMYDANMPFERVVQASVDLILHGIASPPIRDAIPPERKQP
jgi:hypothetical protein